MSTDLSNVSIDIVTRGATRLRRRVAVLNVVLAGLVLAGIWTGDARFIGTALVAFVPWGINLGALNLANEELARRVGEQ